MKKVLVTFASRHGATAEIARSIAKVLRASRLSVTIHRVESVSRLPEYDAVVMGSAIYIGEWLPQAREFLADNANTLRMQHVWLFSSGPTGDGNPIELLNGAIVPESLQEVVSRINPRGMTVFHGKIDLRRLKKEERVIIKAAAVPKGDFRNWQAIKFWAQQIADALKIVAIDAARERRLMEIVS